MFLADDLVSWLIGVLADAGRRRMTALILGTDQERELRAAATAAVQLTAAEVRPGDDERAGQMAMVIIQVFGTQAPEAPQAGLVTLLEELQAGIAAQLAVLGDADLTGTPESSADVLGVSVGALTEKLTGHLIREILVRGSRGGPLFPLASQLNDDLTHLQGKRLEGMLGEVASELRHVLARVATAPTVEAVPVALAGLPPVPAGFTGRDDELAALAELLDPASTAGPVVVSAVAGLAGVGKTALAVKAGNAAWRRGWFKGGVLFVDLHGYDEVPVRPGQALDALLRALGVAAEHIPPSIDERAGLYRSVLARVSEPVLVILDNASSEAQARPLMLGTGRHRVLVTSRHTLAGLDARLVDVTVLNAAASVALLEQTLHAARPSDERIRDYPEAASRLAEICGRLPLALQIVAAVLKADPVLSVGELVGELSAEHERLERLRYDDGSDPSRLSVSAAFDLSYRRLDETSARVFRLLPVNPGPAVSSAAVAALADLPVSRAQEVMAELARAHLAEAAAGIHRRWSMHDLIRLYAQRLSDESMDADEREHARDRLLNYYLRTALAADNHIRALPGMAAPKDFSDRDAALAWLDEERASLIPAVSMAADTGRTYIAVHLPNALVEYFGWRYQYDDWLTTAAIGLDASRRLGHPRDEGTALNHLGLALMHRRRFDEAITAHYDAAAIFREVGDRHCEGMAQFNLGMALSEVRRFDEATTAFRKDLEICSATGDVRGAAKTLNCLGISLREIGEFDEAIMACQDAASIHRRIGDRHGEGLALNNLGAALSPMRRFEEMIAVCRDAAAILQETGDRHSLGPTLMNLGIAMQELRQFDEAIAAQLDAVAIFRETGDRHGEAGAQVNLSVALRRGGRSQEAITAGENAVALFRETGDRHGEATGLDSVGTALCQMRQFGEAIAVQWDAVAIFRETGDKRGEHTALDNLGTSLREAGTPQEAITILEDAVALSRETGDRHGEAIVLSNVGLALRELRRLQAAITAFQDAAALFAETGDRHGEAGALNNLGVTLQEAGRSPEAIAMFEAAAAMVLETGDRDGGLASLTNLGRVMRELGRWEGAIVAYQRELAIHREIGDRHGEAAVLNNLGLALRQMRQFGEAIIAFQGAAAIYRDTGDRHDEAMMLYNLGLAMREADRSEEAVTTFRDAAASFSQTGDQRNLGITMMSLGVTLLETRRFAEAIAAEQETVRIFQATGDRYAEAAAMNNVGRAFEGAGRFNEAISAFHRAITGFQEAGNRHGEGIALHSLGIALRKVHRFDDAITACHTAATIYKETGDPDSERMALDDLEAARVEKRT